MKAALLGGDRFEGDVLRNLKAAILDEEIKQNKRDEGLGDDEVEKVIIREIKRRNDSARMYDENKRVDLADLERREANVIEKYLPAQMNEDQIRDLARQIMSATGANSPQQMGQVIGGIKAKAGNTADGATVARVVKDLLSNEQ